ncbi:hypothetical protein D3C80_1450260 [compost metagenome]
MTGKTYGSIAVDLSWNNEFAVDRSQTRPFQVKLFHIRCCPVETDSLFVFTELFGVEGKRCISEEIRSIRKSVSVQIIRFSVCFQRSIQNILICCVHFNLEHVVVGITHCSFEAIHLSLRQILVTGSNSDRHISNQVFRQAVHVVEIHIDQVFFETFSEQKSCIDILTLLRLQIRIRQKQQSVTKYFVSFRQAVRTFKGCFQLQITQYEITRRDSVSRKLKAVLNAVNSACFLVLFR